MSTLETIASIATLEIISADGGSVIELFKEGPQGPPGNSSGNIDVSAADDGLALVGNVLRLDIDSLPSG